MAVGALEPELSVGAAVSGYPGAMQSSCTGQGAPVCGRAPVLGSSSGWTPGCGDLKEDAPTGSGALRPAFTEDVCVSRTWALPGRLCLC